MEQIKKLLVLLAIPLVLVSCTKNIQSADTTETSSDVSVSSAQGETFSAIAFGEEATDASGEQGVTENSIKPNENNKTSAEAVQNEISPDKVAETENSAQAEAVTTQSSDNSQQLYVTISVDCKNAINYGILSVGTFSKVLPSDGIILAPTQAAIDRGDSVLKVLKTTLKQNNIAYSAASSGYVSSIGGLSEFDCGNSSGWLYSVDGVLPSYSCKSYTLNGGENIRFVYTCVKGDV